MQPKRTFYSNNNVVLVLDNVRFHHCAEIKTFLESLDVEIMYLPAYLPGLNPIENAFSCINQRLDRIRPRATTIGVRKGGFQGSTPPLQEWCLAIYTW